MAVIAIARVKDEADVIVDTVSRMLLEVDEVIVVDNASTDGTRELLEQLPVHLIDDPDPAYYQSARMTELAAFAADRGADWVIPFDADERWYSPFGRIADVLAEQTGVAVAAAALYDHVASAEDPTGDPFARIGWRRLDPAPLPKVACRPRIAATIHQGNHAAGYTSGAIDGLLVIRHFPYRSVDQFVSKVRNGAAAYAATDLPDDQGAHWRQYGQLLEADGESALGDVFRTWFWSANPSDDETLIFDPCP